MESAPPSLVCDGNSNESIDPRSHHRIFMRNNHIRSVPVLVLLVLGACGEPPQGAITEGDIPVVRTINFVFDETQL
jgi:hypothetical protein